MKWIFLLAVMQANVCMGQNLIPNGSVEDANICSERHQPCSPAGWFYIRKLEVTGYYSPNFYGDNWRYLTVMTANRNDETRRYWETMLLCPHVPGEKYIVRIRVAANAIGPNLNDIGFYFTDKMIFSRMDTMLQPDKYFSFLGAKVKELHNSWFQLEKELTATEVHRYLIVGNFSKESNRHIYRKRNIKVDVMSMYLDNMEILPVSGQVCADTGRVRDSLYAVHPRHSMNGRPLITVVAQELPDDTPVRRRPDTLAGRRADTFLVRQPDTPTTRRADTFATRQPETLAARQIDTLTISNIHFAFNSYTLKDPAVLDPLKRYFVKGDVKKVVVVGYTDDIGTDAYNLTLSEKRAGEIRRLILEQFRIAPALITAEGKGISTSYADKSQNRRVEVYIYHG